MNLLINNHCPECKNPEIKKDKQKAYYCTKCGLVVKTQELPTLQDLEYLAAIKQDPDE